MHKEQLVIVYYGPAKAGKTQNLVYLHAHLPVDTKGKPVSTVLDEYDRILSIEFVYRNTAIRLQCLGGAVYLPQSRQTVLQGASAVVFVADSLANRLDPNLRALHEFEDYVTRQEHTFSTFPWILQYTKQDLPKQHILPVTVLQERLNPDNVPSYVADTNTGKGVIETFHAILQRAMQENHKQ